MLLVLDVLTTTSDQRPPTNHCQSKPAQIKFNSNFDFITPKKRPPMYNGHYFEVPRVAVVDRL